MDLEGQFLRACPGGTFLQNDLSGIEQYLSRSGWIRADEKVVSIEKPGEGNMNFVVRVKTNQRQFIVKQSRPYVEKYPQIEAPIERIATEAAINQHLSGYPELQSILPMYIITTAPIMCSCWKTWEKDPTIHFYTKQNNH